MVKVYFDGELVAILRDDELYAVLLSALMAEAVRNRQELTESVYEELDIEDLHKEQTL
jgi:hypothetical protein